jgi:hypothetical protein
MRTTAQFIITWQHPKRFQVWIGELVLLIESFLAHPINHQMLSDELP